MSVDQGGGDYGFMGNKIIRTPALDAMANKSAYRVVVVNTARLRSE